MRIKKIRENVKIYDIEDFNLGQTLECGQCFRFDKIDADNYVVIASERAVRIEQKDSVLTFYNVSKDDVVQFWINYFDLQRDYGAIKRFLLKQDTNLADAINEKSGVRIMNQEFEEMVISFIISQNKQIPHIKQLIERLSNTYGAKIATINGKDYYSFPTLEKLAAISVDEWRELKVGFRAPYLYDASQKLYSGEVCKNICLEGESIALSKLTSIKGVGEKVANCVMLFSLGYRSAFPVDVWIKRIMEYCYFDGKDTSKAAIHEFAKEKYGEYGGYAQQYLFCYGRELKLGK